MSPSRLHRFRQNMVIPVAQGLAIVACCACLLLVACAGKAQAPEVVEPLSAPNVERYTNAYGMEFVYIQPGTFTMGSPLDEVGRDSSEHPHNVTISSGFYIQTTEVTQGQWEQVMGDNPAHFLLCGEDCPVENISWEMAQDFIGRLNELENTIMYRLPTEAEWEYAARAGTGTAYHTGPSTERHCCDEPNLDKAGWFVGNSVEGTHPVKQKQPNAWGLYDVHGNVWEWCLDREAPYSFSDRIDKGSPPHGLSRIRRGGAWNSYPRFCRSAFRGWLHQNDGSVVTGLRIVRDPNLHKPLLPEPIIQSEPEIKPRLIAEIYFKLDRSDISSEMMKKIEDAATIINSEPGDVSLQGNACDMGTEPYNEGLSKRRSIAVKDALVSLGVSPERIEVHFYGETRPKYELERRELNRRVDIYLVGPAKE